MAELTKKELDEKYNHKDMPKIENYLFNFCGCFMKIFAMTVFGVGAVILAVFVFPFIRLFTLRRKDFGVVARAYVSHTFRVFLGFLNLLHVSIRKVENEDDYRNIHSKIIIANHPSLLDFVYIMSLVPNSTCIVRGGLTKTPLRGVIKQAYITNTTTFEDMCLECKKLTDMGCNVIIFPEGTRCKVEGEFLPFKGGSFKIAEKSKCDIVPFAIINSAAIFENTKPRVKKAKVGIVIGEPIKTETLTKEEMKKLPEQTRDTIINLYNSRKEEII